MNTTNLYRVLVPILKGHNDSPVFWLEGKFHVAATNLVPGAHVAIFPPSGTEKDPDRCTVLRVCETIVPACAEVSPRLEEVPLLFCDVPRNESGAPLREEGNPTPLCTRLERDFKMSRVFKGTALADVTRGLFPNSYFPDSE